MYTLPKVVRYLSVLVSVHVNDGFPKQLEVWIAGWVGGVSSIQFYFGFLELFNFAKSLSELIDLINLSDIIIVLYYRLAEHNI